MIVNLLRESQPQVAGFRCQVCHSIVSRSITAWSIKRLEKAAPAAGIWQFRNASGGSS